MSCDKDAIKRLREMANDMERANKQDLERKLIEDFESLLDNTEVLADAILLYDAEKTFRIQFFISRDCELYKRFKEVYREDGYPGLQTEYRGKQIWLEETCHALTLRCGPFPETDKNDFEFLKFLPKKDITSIKRAKATTETSIVNLQERLKKINSFLEELE
jgi:hypothetical protein